MRVRVLLEVLDEIGTLEDQKWLKLVILLLMGVPVNTTQQALCHNEANQLLTGDVTMFKLAMQQNIISLIILAVCFALMFITTPHASLEPHGIGYRLQPAHDLPALSQDEVRVTETPSDNAVAIGHVSAEIAFTAMNSALQQQSLLDYVKRLSGKMGANELVINIFGSTPENIMVLRGYAYKSA